MGMSFGYLFVILFAFGSGNMGIPMGMAPGPEDPIMAKIAPDDCVAYASWSGFVDVDAKANPTEAWMSQPKVRAAGNKFRKAIWDMFSAKAARRDPIVIAGTELLVEVGRIGSVSPGAFYADQIDFSKNPQLDFNGGLLVSLGDGTAKVQKQFDDFAAMLPKFSDDENSAYQVKEIDGEKVIHVEAPQFDFEMNLKMHGKYFFIGFGEGSVAKFKKNSKTDVPKWLVDLRETLKIDRVSSVSYLNSKPILKQVKDNGLFDGLFQGGPLEKIVDADSVGWVSGVDSKGFLTRADIKKSKTKSGVLSIIELDPIPKRLVNDIPKDTNFVLATRISTKAILKLMRQVTRAAGEESIEDSLSEFQKFTGVKLETELLAAVGDFFYAYYAVDSARFFDKGWVISVRIEDEMSFPAIFDRLNTGLRKWAKGSEIVEFKVQKEGLYEIYSLVPENTNGRFAWAIVEDQWYFAAEPKDLADHIKRSKDKNTKEDRFVAQPFVKEVYEFGDKSGFGAPVTIGSIDFAKIIKMAWPFFAGMKLEGRVEPEFDFLWSDVPPLEELTKDVQPNILAIYRTETGFQLYQRQTYPGASPVVALATSSSLWLVWQTTWMNQK